MMQAVSAFSAVTRSMAPSFGEVSKVVGAFLKNHAPTAVTGLVGSSLLIVGTVELISVLRNKPEDDKEACEKAMVVIKAGGDSKAILERVANALEPRKEHGRVEKIRVAAQNTGEKTPEELKALVVQTRKDVNALLRRGPGFPTGYIVGGAFFLACAFMVHRYMKQFRELPRPLPVKVVDAALKA